MRKTCVDLIDQTKKSVTPAASSKPRKTPQSVKNDIACIRRSLRQAPTRADIARLQRNWRRAYLTASPRAAYWRDALATALLATGQLP